MFGDTWHRGIDSVAIQRALHDPGACPALTSEEQRHVVKAMTEAGSSAREIGGRIGVDKRTVDRWRKEMGLQCSG
ncbi:helix-turn-helix domain-containing protein [Streptomyces sp. NPDC001552]|uniref:helix-turn-helix domain-containing protein n=1 Tax=Streptomyces sp. NPDC001552 TaxID=3364587 RepID=UPI0036CA27AC